MSARWPSTSSRVEELALAGCCALVGAAVAVLIWLGCTRQAENLAHQVAPR